MLTFDKFCQYVRYERTYMRASCHPASSKKKYIYIHIKWKKMFSHFPFAVTRIFLNVQTFLVISSHFSLFNTCNFFPRFFISPFNLRYKSKPTINPREYVNVRKKGEGRNWRIHPADTYIFISTRSNRAASENDAEYSGGRRGEGGEGHVSRRCADAFAQVESARVNWSYQY